MIAFSASACNRASLALYTRQSPISPSNRSAMNPSQESPLARNSSLFEKNAGPIPDPLCKLHLRETSEFVKSFPMSHKNRGFLEVSSQRKTRLDQAPSTPGRPISSFSSKWEEAEKWVIGNGSHGSPASTTKILSISSSTSSSSAFSQVRTSCENVFNVRNTEEDFSEKPRATQEKLFRAVPSFQISPATLDHHEVPSPTDMVLQDKFTDKKGSNFPNFGDIGTEMTPLGSSTTLRCHTPPFKSSSPARHNTPANRSAPFTNLIQLQNCHFAKLQLATKFHSNWSSREEEEEEASKSLRHHAYQTQKAAWEEEEKAKSCLRYQLEEAKIRAWLNLQSAKAEAQSKKLEVKIEKMRWKQEEKVRKRMEAVKRKAEEWRKAAREQHMMEKPNQDLKNPFSSYATSCACLTKSRIEAKS